MPPTPTPQSHATTLTLSNLTAIFAEKSPSARMKAIQEIWVPSSEVFFVDALGVYKSHEAISGMVEGLQGTGGEGDEGDEGHEGHEGHKGDEFVALGDVECLKHDDEDDVWVTKVKWGIRTASSGEIGLTGEDVVTIVGGKIKACYTFLNSK